MLSAFSLRKIPLLQLFNEENADTVLSDTVYSKEKFFKKRILVKICNTFVTPDVL